MKERHWKKAEVVGVFILLLVILGLVLQNIDLRFKSKQAVCRSNIRVMNAAASLSYAQHLVNYRRAKYPAVMTGNLFSEGQVPTCPFTLDYLYNSRNGEVASHNHLFGWPWRN